MYKENGIYDDGCVICDIIMLMIFGEGREGKERGEGGLGIERVGEGEGNGKNYYLK